jgi:hypothetical protein
MADTDALKRHTWGGVLYTVIVVSAVLMGTLVWLFWPYPEVTAKGAARLTNLDERGYYTTGDVIRWVTPQVCQPTGRTDVEISAVLDFKNETGGVAESDTLVVSRSFDVKGFPECVTDNPTSVYVDGSLPTGTYRFIVRGCVDNPTPRAKCEDFAGPSNVKIVRIAGNEPDPVLPK